MQQADSNAEEKNCQTLPDSCSFNFELRIKAIFKSRLNSLLINIFVAWQQPTRLARLYLKMDEFIVLQ